MDTTESDRALYLFCLAATDVADALASHRSAEDEASPRTHAIRDVTAVVEPVDPTAWTGPEGEANMKDIEWVGPRAVRHEEIVETAMEASPVYPMPFGTLFSDVETLRETIDDHYDEIVSFLERIEGRREWGIKGWMEREQVESHLVERDGPDPSSSDAPGTAYLQRQKERRDLDERIDAWLDDRSIELAEHLEAPVEALVDAGPKRAEMQEDGREIVYNWAALASDDELDALRRQIETLNETYRERGIELVLSGPWPPYNFRPWSEHEDVPDSAVRS
jgi:hypothetical protein